MCSIISSDLRVVTVLESKRTRLNRERRSSKSSSGIVRAYLIKNAVKRASEGVVNRMEVLNSSMFNAHSCAFSRKDVNPKSKK